MKGDVLSIPTKAKSGIQISGQEVMMDSDVAKDISYISRKSGMSTFLNEYNSQFKTKKEPMSQASTINLPQAKDQDISASAVEETEVKSERKSIRVLLKGL